MGEDKVKRKVKELAAACEAAGVVFVCVLAEEGDEGGSLETFTNADEEVAKELLEVGAEAIDEGDKTLHATSGGQN